MIRKLLLGGFVAGIMLATLTAGAAKSTAPARSKSSTCFPTRNWTNWTAAADASAMYIRVLGRGIYRLDFSVRCPAVQRPNAQLVAKADSDWICSPLDINLKIGQPGGFTTPCIVSKITPLTADEVKALPKELIPSP